ncbi:phytoene/squalene synthase family protein [Methyloraptor flagellatus]|uniref:Phytoene/squalene synthase family protein n=1 Tax=Methyloraptor flagellatus TaxID=3162530 RepID=A0AAU7XES8_9HYPH
MAADPAGALNEVYAQCEALVRERDRDRWLAALFMPEAARRHVHAVLAFAGEIARIRDLVSDPLPGEVRCQWWREVIEGERAGEGRAHPVGAALLDTIERFSLPVEAFVRLIDARIFDLYDDPMPSVPELEGYTGDTSSALIQLAAIILAEGRDPGTADAAGHAGVAYAVTGLCRAFAFHASRGQIFLPMDVFAGHGVTRDQIVAGEDSPGLRAALAEIRGVARRHLGATRRLIGAVPPSAAAAFLPVALVEPYLDRMDRRDYLPFRHAVELPQWRRQWILWRASRKARRG